MQQELFRLTENIGHCPIHVQWKMDLLIMSAREFGEYFSELSGQALFCRDSSRMGYSLFPLQMPKWTGADTITTPYHDAQNWTYYLWKMLFFRFRSNENYHWIQHSTIGDVQLFCWRCAYIFTKSKLLFNVLILVSICTILWSRTWSECVGIFIVTVTNIETLHSTCRVIPQNVNLVSLKGPQFNFYQMVPTGLGVQLWHYTCHWIGLFNKTKSYYMWHHLKPRYKLVLVLLCHKKKGLSEHLLYPGCTC